MFWLFDNVRSHIGTSINRIIEDNNTLDEDGLLYDYDVHLYRVEIFFRDKEDSLIGLHIDAEVNASSWYGYNPDYHVDSDMSRCPSDRRHGIVMYFDGYESPFSKKENFVVTIFQHKGQEYISKFSLEEYEKKIEENQKKILKINN